MIFNDAEKINKRNVVERITIFRLFFIFYNEITSVFKFFKLLLHNSVRSIHFFQLSFDLSDFVGAFRVPEKTSDYVSSTAVHRTAVWSTLRTGTRRCSNLHAHVTCAVTLLTLPCRARNVGT